MTINRRIDLDAKFASDGHQIKRVTLRFEFSACQVRDACDRWHRGEYPVVVRAVEELPDRLAGQSAGGSCASGLRAGDIGTVVERHVVPGVPEEGYSVEFFDMTGNTVAVITLPASALRIPTPADRPTVRALSA